MIKKEDIYYLMCKVLYQRAEESNYYIDESQYCEEYKFFYKFKEMVDWINKQPTKPWPQQTDLGKIFDDFIFGSCYRWLLYLHEPDDKNFSKGYHKIPAKRNIKKDITRFEKNGIIYSYFDFSTGKVLTNVG
jgi:hypothetical protein